MASSGGGDFSAPLSKRSLVDDRDFTPLAHCSTCNRPAKLTLFEVANEATGELTMGPASEFCTVDNNANPFPKLRDGYRYKRAVGFCAQCYTGAHIPKAPAPPRVQRAWAWLIEQWGRAVPNVSDPNTDDYLEIVNTQARASGTASAIPPLCFLEHVWGCTYDQAIKRQEAPHAVTEG